MSSPVERMKELGLVAFEMHSRLAIPTVSGNKRKWTEQALKGAIPHYIGKPVMLDHSQGVGDVVAKTMDAFWGPSKVREEDKLEALRAHSFGIMDEKLFMKLRTDGKNVIGVPLVKGVSIGGTADVEYDEEGNEIPYNFIPEEYSITPFPGIKEAEIETMVPIMESLRSERTVKLKQRLRESQLPEFIPIFLIPLRGESCPEGYVLDPALKACVVPQQMAKLGPEVQEHLKQGAPGYTLITDPADKPVIYVKNEWLEQAAKAVGETGKPPKDWWDRCIDGVTKSGGADDPPSVCGNVWFNILGEWAKQRIASAAKPAVLELPKEAKEVFTKLAEQLKKPEVKVPDNLFTQTALETMTPEEQESFHGMLLDIERQKRGLPPLHEAEHGDTTTPDADGNCPEGYKMGDDGMCHLTTGQPESGRREKVTHQKIVEDLTSERDELKEKLEKVDVLKAERDQLKRRLEQERSLWKAIEEGKRLPASTGKGKATTQTPSSIETGRVETSEDAVELYNHFVQQGFSRKDATAAAMLKIMAQEVP